MEGTLVMPKRAREEAQVEEGLDSKEEEYSKRHKPYNHILSLLDSEEEESTQDLSPLITTLQKEITCASDNTSHDDAHLLCPTPENDQFTLTITTLEDNTTTSQEEESDKERVMRHLLHASDDELGIPSSGDNDGFLGFGEDRVNIGDEFSSLCDKLWELEDERANYYAFLQSELFLGGH
ncbi:hypothetical protein Fmac_003273 [Flemingia macrophylla]|uniref:Uncharacterized protein n=1 Tax=Flemingia macrophylla TaxID=520843 RepID=A0ABD1NMA7_9FABA